jgi:hypothetical protein
VPIGGKGDKWQDIGSAETYARRYCLVALTGVAPGGDDNDGANANAGRQASAPEVRQYLPAGLYDLGSLTTRKEAETMFYTARGAGHLGLYVQMPDGSEILFGDWLRATGGNLPEVAPEDQVKVEADAEAAEAAAVAAHEAEVAAQASAESAAREAALAAKDERAESEPEGDR